MNISPELSMIIKKAETRLGKDNIFGSRYLIIRKDVPKLDYGLFSYYIRFIAEIEEAISHNMTPVVDMLNYKSPFHGENEVGKVNAWEQFFEQPCGVGVEEALQSGKARYIWYDNPPIHPNDSLDFLYNDDFLKYYHLIQTKYLRIKPDLVSEYEENVKSMFSGERVVGVLARGTDYSGIRPWYHPIQPDTEQILPVVRKYMKDYDCTKVFLATEDESILERFKTEFGTNLVYVDQKRLNGSDCWLHENKEWTSISPVKRARDYLGAIYALSKCNGIVSGRTSGAVGALLMSDGYEFKHIFTFGRYGVDDEVMGRVKF